MDEKSPLLKPISEIEQRPNGVGNESNDDVDSPLAGIAKAVAVPNVEKETKEKFAFRQLTRRNKLVLVLLALSNFFTGCGFSLLAPFFPQEAEKKGVSTTVTGLIFSMFQFVILVTSPIYGNFLTRIGPKFLFVSGILVGGTCAILFGTLHRSPSGTPFIVICFACRSVEALGLSAFITSSFAIISNEFPRHVATVFGLLETANGVGLMAGPALGGFLYEAGGFGLPFYVIGAAILATGTLMFFFLPLPEDVKHDRKANVFSLLKSPMIWFSSLGILHLDLYGITSIWFGAILVIVTGFNQPLIVVGNLMVGVGFLLIGPSQFLDFLPFKLWVIIIGLVLAGTFFAAIVVPSIKCLLLGAIEIGFENNLDTYGIVSGLFVSIFSVGAFVSPMMSGVIVDEIGFRHGVTVVSGINFFAILCCASYFLLRWCKREPSLSENVVLRYDSIVSQEVTEERVDITSYLDHSKTDRQQSTI
ncbi:hypothetical protein Btru_042116 [Bulinus truncatus]|nr:hypothetical protein Btru_042116 [Bulinus truncatus]